MRQHAQEITVQTQPRSFCDITRHARAFIAEAGLTTGLLTAFVRHTSASLVVQESADPDVRADLADALDRLAPEGAGWRHENEGPDDMPAHVKSALTATSVSIPVLDGAPALGTWQALYLIEHRSRPHARKVALHVLGS